MFKNNKWTKGPKQLIFPPLTEELLGKCGCRLQKATFDPMVGDEVYLLLLEGTDFCQELARTRPFNILCKSGLVRTNHGLVLFLLFTITDGKREVASYELLLNPHQIGSIEMLSAWGQQSHLKAVLMDNHSSEEIDWFEFENNYGMDKVVSTIAECIGHEDRGDFQLAQQEFFDNYELNDLKIM